MQDLRITVIQTSLFWEDRKRNVEHFSALLNQVNAPTDLIVLPEMFTTGFTMKASELAEYQDGEGLRKMKEWASTKNAVITGSIITGDNEGRYFNRLYWVRPDGTYETYDKRHLFRMANEHASYSGGEKRLVVSLNGWRICPLICYDLRFPVWCRNRRLDGANESAYDVMVCIANWPERRSFAWKSLLIARSIENQAYVIGVNRIGMDGNDINYSGDSIALDPQGRSLTAIPSGKEAVATVILSASELEEYRKAFPVHLDADAVSVITQQTV
ncbi:MAG: amidohydrolase [Flavobacteriales bacterium]|nr:amidohydrolase [Flavobacteriales bacterium]